MNYFDELPPVSNINISMPTNEMMQMQLNQVIPSFCLYQILYEYV